MTGLVAVVATLALATGAGLWHRQRHGRLRPVTPTSTRATAATPPGRSGGPVGHGEHPGSFVGQGDIPEGGLGGAGAVAPRGSGGPVDGELKLLNTLGVRPGTPATLLQFSSAFCAPCRATRRVLAEVAELLDGVRHVEVDAESQLAAVRALGIWRTPTVLVVDADGRVVQRAAGVPAKAHVIAALAPLLSDASP